MKIRHGLWMLGGAVTLGGAIIVLSAGRARSEPPRPANNILAAAFDIENAPAVQVRLATSQRAKVPVPVSGSVMTSVREALVASGAETLSRDQVTPRSDTSGNDFRPPSRAGSQGCPNVFKADGRGDDEGRRGVDNVRVNQDCT